MKEDKTIDISYELRAAVKRIEERENGQQSN